MVRCLIHGHNQQYKMTCKVRIKCFLLFSTGIRHVFCCVPPDEEHVTDRSLSVFRNLCFVEVTALHQSPTSLYVLIIGNILDLQ